MKGNTITAIIDCKQQQNRAIKREAGDTIIHDGIILLAQQIDDNTFFEVFKNFEIEIFSISLMNAKEIFVTKTRYNCKF